jgi:tetratricopeptide (TPR) repeat protein
LPGRFALIIAVDHYSDNRLKELRAPSSDAESLAAVLADPDIGQFEVQSIINESAQRVREEVERFFKSREPDDLLLLYFACHGVKDPRGRLYMAMADTRLDLLASRGLAAQFVNEQLESCRSRRIVLMLDCCYSGAYAKGFASRGDTSVGVLEKFEGYGRVVLTASDALEYAFEEDELTESNGHSSIFTGAVVRGLRTGDADIDQDGRVSVDDLYAFAFDEVRAKTPNQTPGRVYSVSGSIYLATNPRMPASPESSIEDPFAAAKSQRRWEREDAPLKLRELAEDADEAISKAARNALEKLSVDRERMVRASAMEALGDVAKSHYERGLVLADNGDLVGAAAEFDTVISSSNTTPKLAADAYFNRGVLAAAAGDGDVAEAKYLDAISSGIPKVASRAALNLGCLYQSMHRDDDAIAMYETALGYGDTEVTPRAAFLLARKYEIRREVSKAWRYYAMSADYEDSPFAAEAENRSKDLLISATEEDVLIRLLAISGYANPTATGLLWLIKSNAGQPYAETLYKRLVELGDASLSEQAEEVILKAKDYRRAERRKKVSGLFKFTRLK